MWEKTSPPAGPSGGALCTSSVVHPIGQVDWSPLPTGCQGTALGDLPTAPAFPLLAGPEVQGHLIQGPAAHSTRVSHPWPQPQFAPRRDSSSRSQASGLGPTASILPLTPARLSARPTKTNSAVPRQCPPEVHLLNSWAQAEESSQQDGALCRQWRLAQPEKERGGTLSQQVRVKQDQWARNRARLVGKEPAGQHRNRKKVGTREGQTGTWGHTDLGLRVSVLLTGCVSLHESFKLSEPQFPYLANRTVLIASFLYRYGEDLITSTVCTA